MKRSAQRFRLMVTSVVLGVACWLGPTSAVAASLTYYVSSWNPQAADNCATGTSPSMPMLHIESALACPNVGTIMIEALDATHFIYNPGGTLVITSNVKIIGTGPNFIVPSPSGSYPAIDGQGLFRVIENLSPATEIHNVEIDNGKANGAACLPGTHCLDRGGGIWNHPGNAGLTLYGVFVYGNSANFGGGIYNEGTLTADVDPISNEMTTFSTNTATGGYMLDASGNVIDLCTRAGGLTGRGGAIYNDGTAKGGSAGTLTLIQTQIIASTATSGGCAHGGGIFNDSGSVSMGKGNKAISSILSNNATGLGGTAGGGGIANFAGTVNIGGSTVSDNTLQCPIFVSQPATPCGVGAGIFNLDVLTLGANAVVHGNHASSFSGPIEGAGIANGASLNIYAPVTISSNHAAGASGTGSGQGGGIFNQDPGTVAFHKTQTTKVTMLGPDNLPDNCGGTSQYSGVGQATSLPACPDGP